jgi:pimeloyl-ACP methyl ester carboxylesterase
MTRWILLRGLTREARHWGDLPGSLGSRLGGDPVLAIDLPGNGSRCLEPSPLSIARMMASARASLGAARESPPYVLVGMSLGAMIAMAWASARPDEVAGVVLLNSSSRGLSPWYRRLRWLQLPTMLRIATTRDPAVRESRVLRLTTRHPPQPEGPLIASWIAWRREHPVSTANAIRQLIAAARFQGPAMLAPVPVLVLTGAKDALVDPACSLALANAWGGELRIHPTAGHDLTLDDGAWVTEQIAEWWRRIGPQA